MFYTQNLSTLEHVSGILLILKDALMLFYNLHNYHVKDSGR